MIYLSEFIPLDFGAITDKFGLDACFLSEWYHTDVIRLQAWSNSVSDTLTAKVINLATGAETAVTLTRTQVSSRYYFDGAISMLSDGIYYVELISGDGMKWECEPFSVSSSRDILETTSLIRFSSSTDILPFESRFNQGAIIFEWRIKAGLKPNGFQPKISDETYRTQTQEGRHLYSVPFNVWALTIGDAVGVPYWYADLINKVLCLDLVNLDDYEIRRSESEVPELTETYVNSQMFILRQNVELIDGADARIIRNGEYDNNEYNNDYAI